MNNQCEPDQRCFNSRSLHNEKRTSPGLCNGRAGGSFVLNKAESLLGDGVNELFGLVCFGHRYQWNRGSIFPLVL